MTDDVAIQVLEYQTEDGRIPYREWLHSLRDRQARARVRVRVDRVSLGNLGDWGMVGGGDKRTQAQDIELAQAYWADYQQRTA